MEIMLSKRKLYKGNNGFELSANILVRSFWFKKSKNPEKNEHLELSVFCSLNQVCFVTKMIQIYTSLLLPLLCNS